jgi:hypothetical protein
MVSNLNGGRLVENEFPEKQDKQGNEGWIQIT